MQTEEAHACRSTKALVKGLASTGPETAFGGPAGVIRGVLETLEERFRRH